MCDEIEQRMDELARKYVETRDPEIREEIHRLSRELEKMEKLESSGGPGFGLALVSARDLMKWHRR